MNFEGSNEIIIEIDSQIASLIEDINSSTGDECQNDFMGSCRTIIVDSLIGPFGLTSAMFKDRDGGNITTVYNFEKGCYAERDAQRYDDYQKAQVETFDRSDYERSLPSERKEIFNREDEIKCAYTGRDLPKDGRAHRDHVVSAHEIERSAVGHLGQSRADRVKTANMEENKVWTGASLNQSKNDSDLLEWSERQNKKDPNKSNAETNEIDMERTEKIYKTAKNTIEKVQGRAVLEKQACEFIIEGGQEYGKLALRQVIGLLLQDIVEGVIDDIRTLMRDGFESFKDLLKMIKDRIKATIEKIKEKWAEYMKAGLSAGLAGFLSSFTTLIINSFVTTAKNIVRIIREACSAVVRAFKIIVSPPPGMNHSDRAYEVFKILSGVITVAIGIGIEETIKKCVEMVPILIPFSGPISMALTGMITGIAGLLVVLIFDRIKAHLVFKNKQLADVHRGQSVALLRIKRTVILLDQASNYIQVSATIMRDEFNRDWAEIQKLREKTVEKLASYSNVVDNLSIMAEEFK